MKTTGKLMDRKIPHAVQPTYWKSLTATVWATGNGIASGLALSG